MTDDAPIRRATDKQRHAETAAANAGALVQVPGGEDHIHVKVTAGQTVELPPSFDSATELAAKTGEGNLAIKAGDVTVILEGYVDANAQKPVTVETANAQPIDIASVLADTDPNLNIQTAAGPAVGAQGADNGHLLAVIGAPPGLGGFTAVGPQDIVSLSYKLIDNAIREEFGTTPPNVSTSVSTVDESGLPSGSHPGSGTDVATGTILISAPDGVASISIGGTTVDLGDPGKTATIAGGYGDLTITGWDPKTGSLDYSYTLDHAFHHDPIQGANVAAGADQFSVTVTDKDGQTGSGTVSIDIVDDVPTARADDATTCACGDASGNVLANDTPGADGIVAIISLTDGGHVYALNANGTLTSNDAAGNYSYDQATGVLEIFKTSAGGTLEIDLTGTDAGAYAYSHGSATTGDDFQYTVVDGDGDKAGADLTIHPDLTPPVATADHVVTLAADFDVSNGQLLANDQPQANVAITGTGNPDHLTLSDLGWGYAVTLDGGATSGSFDYTVTASNAKTDTGSVSVDLVSNASETIDESKSTSGEILIGDSHANVISGGSGDDVLVGGGGPDHLSGNGGNDRILYDGNSTFDGGAGTDRLVFSDAVTLGFDNSFVSRVQSIEVLDLRNGGTDTLGAGKGEALTIDAVLDMTGGKGELWIAAESGDCVTLDRGFTQGTNVTETAATNGIPADVYTTYSATDGTHDVTVHIAASATTHS